MLATVRDPRDSPAPSRVVPRCSVGVRRCSVGVRYSAGLSVGSLATVYERRSTFLPLYTSTLLLDRVSQKISPIVFQIISLRLFIIELNECFSDVFEFCSHRQSVTAFGSAIFGFRSRTLGTER